MTISEDQIIDRILDIEQENGPDYLDRHDRGGRTSWGISERAHPEAWQDGPPSRSAAAAIYRIEYVKPWDWVEYLPLRLQCIDFSVNSGLHRAVKTLQVVLGIEKDGIIGPQTRYWTNRGDTKQRRLVNNALVAFRLAYIDGIAVRDQKINEEGWEDRALSHLVA